MSDQYFVETVKIAAESELGYVVINKTDYDEKLHTLYVEPAEKPPEKPPTTKPPAK